MADAGVISMSLRDAALRAPLNFADDAPPPRRLPPSSVKAINGTRFELMRMLREPSLYTLDRLDLTADSPLDARAIGTAAGRGRVWQYVLLAGVCVSLTKQKKTI